MAKMFLVRYVHVEETTYQDWIEAETGEEAVEIVENGDVNFENDIEHQGVDIINVEVLD